jgi:hypothetical protein
VLLAYVDESYNAERYWIAALLCPEDVLRPLTEALDAVVDKAATAYGTAPNAELHGHALFHGKDDWSGLSTMPRARIGMYNAAFAAIASFDVEIFIRGVDITGLNRRYLHPEHPHAVVLSHLLERIDERAAAVDQWALVIADEVDGADEHRRNLWRSQRFATRGYRARQLGQIVDTIHFAPSKASRLVQAADLIAYLYGRIQARLDTDPRAQRANAVLWDRLALHLVHCHCWHP